MATLYPNAPSSVNPFSGTLSLVVDPRLDAVSATRWYVFADPAVLAGDRVRLPGRIRRRASGNPLRLRCGRRGNQARVWTSARAASTSAARTAIRGISHEKNGFDSRGFCSGFIRPKRKPLRCGRGRYRPGRLFRRRQPRCLRKRSTLSETPYQKTASAVTCSILGPATTPRELFSGVVNAGSAYVMAFKGRKMPGGITWSCTDGAAVIGYMQGRR